MTGPASKASPNWLLRSLIVLSVGIHAVVFLHVSDIYRSSTLSLIELTLQDISKPTAREIPRPRPRPKAPRPRDPVKRLNVVHRHLPRFTPLAIAPAEKNLPATLMEGISAPEIPQAPSADMAALDAVQNAAPFPRPPSSLFKGNLPLELTIVFELT